MSIEASSDDGADIFWPGYVDAVTNLVLNLLFMLTIMIVAVFMFALELSRHKDAPPPAAVAASVPSELAAELAKDPRQQVLMLQREVDALKKQVLQQNDTPKDQKVVIAKTPLPVPDKALRELSPAGGGVIVNFEKNAVVLSPTETETLLAALAPMMVSGAARVEILVPTGFSEARRIAFYRVMAVRNQLIASGLAPDKIEVQIRDGAASAENSRVMVSPVARK
jgi:hypothetical protein